VQNLPKQDVINNVQLGVMLDNVNSGRYHPQIIKNSSEINLGPKKSKPNHNLPTVAALKLAEKAGDHSPKRRNYQQGRVASQLEVHPSDRDRKLLADEVSNISNNKLTPKAARSRNAIVSHRDNHLRTREVQVAAYLKGRFDPLAGVEKKHSIDL
jgi:hypothetical protein